VSVPVSISAVVASSTTHSTVSDALGSSPVFVPLFVPVISDVKASVQSAFCNVYVLLAEFVFVKNEVNVFATLRSPKVVSRKVFSPEFVCADARIISPDPPPPAIVTVTSVPTFVADTQAPTKLKEETALVICVPSSFTGILAVAEIVISPLPSREVEFIVFMFVQDTRIA